MRSIPPLCAGEPKVRYNYRVPSPSLLSPDRALDLLREAERHPACAPALLAYAPLSARELAALTAEQRGARSELSREAVKSTAGWQHLRDMIRELGRARFAQS